MVLCTTQFNLECELVQGLPLYIILAIVVFAVILLLSMKLISKKKDDMKPPPMIDPEKEIILGFKDILKTTGAKVKYKSFLMIGMNRIGRIVEWTPYHYDFNIKVKKNNDSNRTQTELEQLKELIESKYILKTEKANFYMYKVIGSTPFHMFFYMFGNFFNMANERYFLIDQTYIIDAESNNIFIDVYTQPKNFYKTIYVFSSKSQSVIQGLINHLTVKTLLKENVNFIPQMHYFDFRTGKFAGKLREIGENRNKNWKKQSGNKQDQESQDIASADADD